MKSSSGEGERPIQIDEDIPFQRRIMLFQRIGRWFLVVVMAAAVAGFAGAGLFGRQTVSDPSGRFLLEFDRFGRRAAPQTVELRFASRNPQKQLLISIESELARDLEIESVLPEPAFESASSERLNLSINFDSDVPHTIVIFRCRATVAGWIRGQIGVDNSANLPFNQFVYP